jgi:hypothetical protein
MMIKKIDELLNNCVEGEMPKVRFEFPEELTKEVTLRLFKWITLLKAYEKFKIIEIYSSGNVDKQLIEERNNEAEKKRYIL